MSATDTSPNGNPTTATADSLESWSQALDFRALADAYGTPTYVFYVPRMRENFDAYLRLVDRPERLLYPVKTNPALAVLRRLARWGAGMDCASRDEVDWALFAGVPAERISYNTPAPEFGLVRNLLRAGATVVADSEELLRRIDAKIPPAHLKGRLVARLNVDVGGEYLQHFDWEAMVSHGASTSKFGIPAEDIIGILRDIQRPVTGLHVHVGTMMDNLDTFETVFRFLHGLVDEIHAQTDHRIEILNVGGGLGIGFLPGQQFPGIDALAERLAALKRDDLTYYAEPGQSLVGDAMGLLTRVVALKEMRGRRWAVIDVGSDQLMKITTVSWYHQFLDADGRRLALEGPDAVGGPLCFAGDTILPATDLAGVEAGDPLFLQHAGAYLEAIANRFNGRRSAGLVVVDEGGTRRATEPEDPFYSPPSLTYDWAETPPAWGEAVELSEEEIHALHSTYFNEHAQDDRYTMPRFTQTGENTFAFEVETEAAVDFVSIPFALRIAADAVIIAVLRSIGKKLKDVSVWGTKGTFTYREPIQPGRRLRGTVSLSPAAQLGAGKPQRMLTVATLDGGRFSMTSEIVV